MGSTRPSPANCPPLRDKACRRTRFQRGLSPTSPWVASGTSSSCSGLGPSLPRLWEATKHPAYVGEMEAPPLERKLVAILAADVAGYSRMMGIDEEGTLATLSDLRTITDALIAQHSGRIAGRPATACSPHLQACLPRRSAPLKFSAMWRAPMSSSRTNAGCGFESASMSAMSW